MTECEIGNFAPQNNVENGTSLELARVKTGIHVKYLICTNLLMQFTCLQQIFHTYNWKSQFLIKILTLMHLKLKNCVNV